MSRDQCLQLNLSLLLLERQLLLARCLALLELCGVLFAALSEVLVRRAAKLVPGLVLPVLVVAVVAPVVSLAGPLANHAISFALALALAVLAANEPPMPLLGHLVAFP